jgi:hypothetical protein
MAWLIQGIFFQTQEGLRLGYGTEHGMGLYVSKGIYQFPYAGAAWMDDGPMPDLTGRMSDDFGYSELFDIHISEDEVRFSKNYKDRPAGPQHHIHYVFKIRDGNSWVGEYTGERCGTGISRCFITEVPDEFFQPEPIIALLGRDNAHTWAARAKA